jgi:serine/threonine protein phosphatase PrpC
MIRTDVRLGWKSIPGHRHLVEGRENEDAVLVSQEHPRFDALMIVADGMGGHAEPRLAAQTAAQAAHDFLFQPARLDELTRGRSDPTTLLRRAVEHANAQVRRLASWSRSGTAAASLPGAKASPGCTLTVAAVFDGGFAAAHVGDGSVFLLRDNRLIPLAGGEARRFGSRPEEYLGRDDRIEIEVTADAVQPGDRLLLCTDGLTRYFGQSGEAATLGHDPQMTQMPQMAKKEGTARSHLRKSATSADWVVQNREVPGMERLQQIAARPSADPQTLASQLTADGRGEQYEDDTTVVIAEIGASHEVPDERAATKVGGQSGVEAERSAEGASPPRESTATPLRTLGYLLLALLIPAAGWFGWRLGRRSIGAGTAPFRPFTAPAVDVSGLPKVQVLLVHPESSRVFVLRTRPVGAPTAEEPLTLRELRFKPGRGIVDTGATYRLDPSRGRLTAPQGRSYPVTVDGATGVIEIQQAGTLRIETPPLRLPVWIDGLAAGLTPVREPVRAGHHQVEVRRRSEVVLDTTVEVPPRGTTMVSKPVSGGSAPPGGGTAGRAVR